MLLIHLDKWYDGSAPLLSSAAGQGRLGGGRVIISGFWDDCERSPGRPTQEAVSVRLSVRLTISLPVYAVLLYGEGLARIVVGVN